jgi:hypothetical protein
MASDTGDHPTCGSRLSSGAGRDGRRAPVLRFRRRSGRCRSRPRPQRRTARGRGARHTERPWPPAAARTGPSRRRLRQTVLPRRDDSWDIQRVAPVQDPRRAQRPLRAPAASRPGAYVVAPRVGEGRYSVRITNETDRPRLSIEMNHCSSICAWSQGVTYRTLGLFAALRWVNFPRRGGDRKIK